MNNPFESLEKKFNEFNLIPINTIFKSKIVSKPTFYDHVNNGRFKLYKLGRKSFVDIDDFKKAFREVIIKPT